MKPILMGMILMIIFYFVGFGPRILFSPPEIFFQTHSLSPGDSKVDFLTKTFSRYPKALLVYVKEATSSTHYAIFEPLLDPTLSVFFITGFFFALFSKNIFLKFICVYALVIPLTNSAITEALNSDHRLLPLIPIASIICAYGINWFGKFLKHFSGRWQKINVVASFILIIFLLIKGISFFWQEKANRQYSLPDYLSMHTVYFLKNDPNYQKVTHLCFVVSPKVLPYFQLLHVHEQYQYFTPGKNIFVVADSHVSENKIYISASCHPLGIKNLKTFSQYQPCLQYQKFICPKTGEPIIFFETSPQNQSFSPPVNQTVRIPPQPDIIP